MSSPTPPWSRRRRRTLVGLGLAAVLSGLAGIGLPDQYGVTALFLAALAAFLLVVATIVFVAIPGPGTVDVLLRSLTISGAVLVVAVLLVLSTAGEPLRWIWVLAALAAAAWVGTALYLAHRDGPPV
jgi:drug/metabolite transporter (DMT)-like permease